MLSCRMVRLIAAALVEVGHGRMTPAQLKRVLDAGNRAALTIEAAPAHGLYLQQVGPCSVTSCQEHTLCVILSLDPPFDLVLH